MKSFHIFYTDFLKNRVQVVTKAKTEQDALENVKNNEKVVNAPHTMPISDDEYDRFATKWKAVA
jgi:hypothetical protein